MNNYKPDTEYSIYTGTESEKYRIMIICRAAGATITGVSGCGTGYYIQIDATPDQAAEINRVLEGGAA